MISDATVFSYVTDAAVTAQEGDTVFFRGTNGYYGAWRLDEFYPSADGSFPYSFLDGQWYFQDDGSGSFVPEPTSALFMFLATGCVFMCRICLGNRCSILHGRSSRVHRHTSPSIRSAHVYIRSIPGILIHNSISSVVLLILSLEEEIMLKYQCLRLALAVSLVTTSVNESYGLVQLNFDQEIFTAPVGTPFVEITATLSLDGQHYLFGGTGQGSTSAVGADASFSLGPDPGETDPNCAAAKFKAQIGDLPGLVPPDENVPITIPITWGYWHLDNWNLENAAGYPGYISATAWFESNGISDDYRIEFYNATEPGSRADDPLLPDSINADGGFEFSFDLAETGIGRNSPLFIDPDVATGYRYSVGSGDANFAIVYIPEPLPLGDDQFELHLVDAVYPLTASRSAV